MKLELNWQGCPAHRFVASPLIYMVKIWWLTLNFHFGVGAWASTELYVAQPLNIVRCGIWKPLVGMAIYSRRINSCWSVKLLHGLFPSQFNWSKTPSKMMHRYFESICITYFITIFLPFCKLFGNCQDQILLCSCTHVDAGRNIYNRPTGYRK